MQQIIAILFLGNSLTYTNDLPGMVMRSSPQAVHAESVTAPGATLQILYEQTPALEKLRSRKWDYVVLQEQGTLGIAAVNGARAVNDPKAFFSWARIWDKEIRAAGAKTVFFHHWARRVNPEDRPHLDYAFAQIAGELRAVSVPAGPAWARMPRHSLYVPDDLHPTVLGTYLTACVFTEALFAKPCLRPPGGVTAADAQLIRAVAAESVKQASPITTPRPAFAAIAPLPAVETLRIADFIGKWEGETRFYRDPSRLTLLVTAEGSACRVRYSVEGPELRYANTSAACVPAPNGVQITLTQPDGGIELHNFQVRDGVMKGVSRIAMYTAYLRREAEWTLRRVE
ncbi:MAG: SGNH/GDSL hydrolase family protein [Bryobacterales bacterium]|nr:SGNH/GDSL hydrolase family protein [Bryobacterales bacterium]